LNVKKRSNLRGRLSVHERKGPGTGGWAERQVEQKGIIGGRAREKNHKTLKDNTTERKKELRSTQKKKGKLYTGKRHPFRGRKKGLNWGKKKTEGQK